MKMQWSSSEPADGAGAQRGGQQVAAGMAGLPGWPKYSDMHPKPSSGTVPEKRNEDVNNTKNRREKEN